MEKFPDHIDAPLTGNGSAATGGGGPPHYQQSQPGRITLNVPPRDSSTSVWTPSGNTSIGRHNRQKSLTDAFRTIRARNGSVGQNAHEIADALRAPLSPKLIVRYTTHGQGAFWYSC